MWQDHENMLQLGKNQVDSGSVVCDHINATCLWRMALQYNAISHWLGAYAEWSLRTDMFYWWITDSMLRKSHSHGSDPGRWLPPAQPCSVSGHTQRCWLGRRSDRTRARRRCGSHPRWPGQRPCSVGCRCHGLRSSATERHNGIMTSVYRQ